MSRLIQHKKEAYWFYRFVSIGYDRFINPFFWNERMRKEALQLAQLDDANLMTLDAGAGTGFTTSGIVGKIASKNVTMLDRSPHQLAKAKQKELLADCQKIEGDVEDLPLRTDTFDRYISARFFMQKLTFLWQTGLTVLTVTLALTAGEGLAGTFSGFAFDPGKIDSGIPGFVGTDGLGNVTPNNVVNPIFVGWATGYKDYLPTPGVLPQWQTPSKTLGPVTGAFDGIASLGELSAEQIASGAAPGQITLTFDVPIQNGRSADFAVFENGFGFAGTGRLFAELAYVEVSTDGINFLRFPSISLTADPLDPFGRIDPTQVYNLAGKHVSNGIVLPDNQFVQASWGTPFDLDVLTDSPDVVSGRVDLNSINFVRVVDIPGNGSFLDSEGRSIYDPWPTPIAGSGGFDLEAIGVINAATVPEPTSIFGLLLTGVLATRLRVGNYHEK